MVCVHCGAAAVRVACEPSPGLDAAQRWLLKGSGGQCPGLGCRLGGQAQQRPLLACSRRPPPYRALSPAGGSLPSPPVKPTCSVPPAPAVTGAVWGGQAWWLHGASKPGGDREGRSRQPPLPRPVASSAFQGRSHRPSEGPETDPTGQTATRPPRAGRGCCSGPLEGLRGPPQPWEAGWEGRAHRTL